MALIADGAGSGALASVDATFKALRTSQRPIEHGALGQYHLAQLIQVPVSAGSNATQLSLRWTDATRLLVLQYARITVQQTAPATATIWPRFQLFIARGFTASDSAGNAITLGANQKMRTSMGASLIAAGDLRFSAAAAGVTAGTRTLDALALAELEAQQMITAVPAGNAAYFEKEWDFTKGGLLHPPVLAQNEGIVVRGPSTAFGIAGTADLTVELAWAEVNSF